MSIPYPYHYPLYLTCHIPHLQTSILKPIPGVTVSAVSHRVRRIKDKAKASGLPLDDDNTGTDPAKSPAGNPVKGGKRGRKPATPASVGKTEGPAAKKVKGGDPTSAYGHGPAEEDEDGEDANEA